MASIYLRNGVWQIQYMRNGKPVRRSLNTRSAEEAKQRKLELEKQLLDARHAHDFSQTTAKSGIKKTKITREELRNWREKEGLTQAEVARRIGVSNQTISLFERGATHRLSDLSLKKLEKLFQKSSGINDPFLAFADDLRHMADTLSNPDIPKKFKAARFTAFIRGYNDGLPIYLSESKILDS